MVHLKTAEGMLHLHFPPSQIQNIKKGREGGRAGNQAGDVSLGVTGSHVRRGEKVSAALSKPSGHPESRDARWRRTEEV